jgi:hypothetical protein
MAESFDGVRCVVLHSGKEVLVGLHRQRDVRVAEAFADDLDRHPFLDQEAPVGVAAVVEPDRGDAAVAGLASGRWTS